MYFMKTQTSQVNNITNSEFLQQSGGEVIRIFFFR